LIRPARVANRIIAIVRKKLQFLDTRFRFEAQRLSTIAMTKIELQKDIQQKLSFLSEKKLEALRNMLDVLLDSDEKLNPPKKQGRGLIGSMPNLVKYMADDFNEPLDDFKEYMPDQNKL
jgi:hypothetical protein